MEYSVIRFKELESTNLEANDVQYRGGDLLVAEYQSGGRGQRGSVWESHRGENLLLSLVLENTGIKVSEQFLVSELASVAVCGVVRDFLGDNSGDKALIKWPNDIVVRGGDGEMRKIAGILIEHSFSSAVLDRSVVGIGLNVSQREFVGDMAWPVTSLSLEGLEGVCVDDVLDCFCRHFSRVMGLLPPDLHKEYMQSLWRTDGFYDFCDTGSGEFFRGRIESVDSFCGTLGLVTDDDVRREYLFKGVRYL